MYSLYLSLCHPGDLYALYTLIVQNISRQSDHSMSQSPFGYLCNRQDDQDSISTPNNTDNEKEKRSYDAGG